MSSGQLPVGFRFMPTDKELVTHYLMNKVFDRPVPAAEAIQDIDATQFYSTHPKNLDSTKIREEKKKITEKRKEIFS
ncbi:hypothetical protein L3X38_004285 [Prunus dulcis]|uniref:NAC domain-containing protein n=1 Tax=Prunus dulcis TaxID=3755 RepID=A0AAD5F317_PRUDU|nr:hypothetical protein L3X38_004285 [Prunus dulcis]